MPPPSLPLVATPPPSLGFGLGRGRAEVGFFILIIKIRKGRALTQERHVPVTKTVQKREKTNYQKLFYFQFKLFKLNKTPLF
jgi:hypothetical protein